MSISREILRLKGLRTDIRTKLINMGLLPSDSNARLAECTEIFEKMYGTTQDITKHNYYMDVAGKHYAKIEDSNLVPSNIKSGVKIFGVTGTYSNNSPALSYDPNNKYYYGAPGAPAEMLPSGTYDGFSSFTFDASSGSNLVADNIKDGVVIMGVPGIMSYNNFKIGYWRGWDWGMYANATGDFHCGADEWYCGASDHFKVLTVPLLSLATNDALHATEFSTTDLQIGRLTIFGRFSSPGESHTVISMEFGKNLYAANNTPYMLIDVLGYRKVHHLKGGGGYEIKYAMNLDGKYSAYLQIRLGESFDYVGEHPSSSIGRYDGDVCFDFNILDNYPTDFQIEVIGESN